MNYRCDGIYRDRVCNRLLFIGDNLTGTLEIKCDKCNSFTLVTNGKAEITSQHKELVV